MAKSTFSIAPASALQKNELYFNLYMHHTPLEPNKNQAAIVDPKLPNSFGRVIAHDWTVYDGLGTDAKLVGSAQGLHVQNGMSSQKYQNFFSIVFEDNRFKGSSLQVMGPVVEEGEWAIVGGTGEFCLAQGVIYKKLVKQQSNGNIIELDVHAFYSAVRPWTLPAV